MSTPTVVRIRLRFNDVETFVEKFAPNVTRGGLFLATRNVRAVGELVSFELLLADGSLALGGEGRITWTKAPDPAQPNKPFGMGVQFVSLRPESKPVLLRLLKAKEALKESRPAVSTTGAHAPLEGSGPVRGSGPTATGERSLQAAPASGTAVKPAPGAPARPPLPRVDPNVDLAQEMGFEEPVLREIASRLRMAPRLTADPVELLEELLQPSPEEPATLSKALTELPRLLSSAARRRVTGALRPLEGPPPEPPAERNGHAAVERVALSGTSDDPSDLPAPT